MTELQLVGSTALVLCAAAVGYTGTQQVIRHAAQWGLIDQPVERSSHQVPKPRGGGAAIVVGSSFTAYTFNLLFAPGEPLIWIMLPLSLLIASVGMRDDIVFVQPLQRLLAQLLAVFALMLALGAMPAIVEQHWLLAGLGLWLLILIAGTWWINAFNFMDGIDGLAASQALFMLAAPLLIWSCAGIEPALAVVGWMVGMIAAIMGFICWNWAPARIFMGDVGSTYLGFMTGGMALLSISRGWLDYPVWFLLAGLFLTDATVTFVTRLLRGKRPQESHRTHVYQRMAQRYGHRAVTLAYAAINLGWLLPLAWLAQQQPELGWLLVLLGYSPLVLLAWLLGAGRD